MKAIAIFILLVALLFTVALLNALNFWSPVGIRGDGVVKTESRDVAEFSTVAVAGAYKVKWTQGKPALTISCDQNLLTHIRTEVKDGALKIHSMEQLRPTRDVEITISSETLAGAELSGANTLTAGQLSATDFKVEATGASTVTLEGSATNLTVSLTGASTLRAKSLQTKNATLTLTGASSADVAVADVLKASLTGACSVNYSGNPKVDKNLTGASSIHHRE